MLTVEEIKKTVEVLRPEGFEIIKRGYQGFYLYLDSEHVVMKKNLKEIWSLSLFDLFLDRCIQAVNKNRWPRRINQMDGEIDVFHMAGSIGFLHDKSTEGIREARIKAIKFVLDNSQ